MGEHVAESPHTVMPLEALAVQQASLSAKSPQTRHHSSRQALDEIDAFEEASQVGRTMPLSGLAIAVERQDDFEADSQMKSMRSMPLKLRRGPEWMRMALPPH